MNVTRLTTTHLRVPLPTAGRIPLAGPKPPASDAIDVVVVQLETDGDVTGIGFTTVRGPGSAAVRSLIDTELSLLVVGEDPRDTDRLLAKVEQRFHAVGFAGLAARAYSAIDIAVWDVKAKATRVPLFALLGNAKVAAPFFVSDLAPLGRSAADVVKLAKPLLKQGATGIVVEVGSGDVQADADRVRDINDGLGEDAAISVAAAGRFDLGTAEALTHFFEEHGIAWFEDPIPASDEPGYAKLASLAEIPLAIGSNFGTREQFFRAIRNGVVRLIRPDVCRLGGITPLLKVAAVAEAFHVAVSPVRLPEVGVHLACGLGVVSQVDSVGWSAEVFSGGPRIEGGKLVPPPEPGLGLSVNEDAIRKWQVG